jgi:succinoglycan biosynthesis protein ExoV
MPKSRQLCASLKIFYFNEVENFGDSLNRWLWPRIFSDIKFPSDVTFVGIGTILDGRIPADGRKVIFGSGYRPSKNVARVDENWDFRFVRGPKSAAKFSGVPWITDSAYCLRLLDLPPVAKRYKISYVAHYMSQMGGLSLQPLLESLGIHFIDPQQPVETVLEEIRASEAVLCEAMHGAIVADAFRIPWHRVKYRAHIHEKSNVSQFKWEDWAQSMELSSESTTLLPAWKNANPLSGLLNRLKVADSHRKLRKACGLPFQMSRDDILNQRLDQLAEAVKTLKKDMIKF